MNINQLFKDHKKLMASRARHYAHKYQVDASDVESEAYVIFTKALSTFDQHRGIKFSTHLYTALKNLYDYCEKEARWDRYFFSNAQDQYFDKFCEALQEREVFCALSEDAKIVLGILEENDCGRYSLSGARKVLKMALDWKNIRIEAAIRELRQIWETELACYA